MHDEDGTVRASGNVSGNAAGHPAAKPGVAVRAENNEACLVLVGRVQDRLPRGGALNRQRLGPEPGGVGERDPCGGGLLSRVPDIVRAGRVELRPAFRDESHVEGPPDGEDDGIATSRQLARSLGDRGPGHRRAVVREQHRTGLVAMSAGDAPAGVSCERRGYATAGAAG
jgi:hypothetical protein